MRTRIISDLHLGHTASRLKSVAMLNPILDGVDHLILAGDVWQQQKVGVGFGNAKSLFQELLWLAKKRGVLVEILRGNHDPNSGKGVAWLADGAVLVTHGDAIYDDATPWSREMGRYREEINVLIQKYAPQSHSAEACSERAREIALTLKAISLPKLPSPFDFLVTALWPLNR